MSARLIFRPHASDLLVCLSAMHCPNSMRRSGHKLEIPKFNVDFSLSETGSIQD
jgi:hypothetical protein